MNKYYAYEQQKEKQRDRMNKYYADEQQKEKQRDRMKEHYSAPENRGKHQNYIKERMTSKRSEGTIESDDDNEISGAEEKILASLNVGKCKAKCLKAIWNSTSIPGKNTHKAFVCIISDQFIIGKEKICLTSMKTLLDNKERLSVGRYEKNLTVHYQTP